MHKKVKLINHDCLPILMLLCIMLYISDSQGGAYAPPVGQETIFVGPGDFLVHYPKKIFLLI